MKKCPLCERNGINYFCRICKGSGFVKEVSAFEKKKRKNDKSRLKATCRNRHYTKEEIALLNNRDLSNGFLAKKLSRSIKAIENARARLRKGELNVQ